MHSEPSTPPPTHRRRSRLTALAAVTVMVIAMLTALAAPASASAKGSAALAWAKTQIGVPYSWGGEGPYSYDCSGLVMRGYQHAGIDLPHNSAAQYAATSGYSVSTANLQPGDLLFYGASAGSIHHVAFFAYRDADGTPWVLDAQQTGVPVNYHRSYSDFYAATRPGGSDAAGNPAPSIKAPASVRDHQFAKLTGTAASGAKVSIYSSTGGGYHSMAATTANGDGSWSYRVGLLHTTWFYVAASGRKSAAVAVSVVWDTTVGGPPSAKISTVYQITGRSQPDAHVVVSFRGPGGTKYQPWKTVTADHNGYYVAPWRATTDYQYIARGTNTSPATLTRVRTDIAGPAKVAKPAGGKAATVLLHGVARPGVGLAAQVRSPSGSWRTACTTTVGAKGAFTCNVRVGVDFFYRGVAANGQVSPTGTTLVR